MSRKDYRAFAEAIRESSDDPQFRKRIADILIPIFRADNSRFDASRFYRACGVSFSVCVFCSRDFLVGTSCDCMSAKKNPA